MICNSIMQTSHSTRKDFVFRRQKTESFFTVRSAWNVVDTLMNSDKSIRTFGASFRSLFLMPLQHSPAPVFRAFHPHSTTLSTFYLNHEIKECVLDGDVKKAQKIFDENPKSRNIVSWNSLINGYIKHRQFSEAQELFDQMPQRDVVSWNTMLSGFRDTRNPKSAHQHFLKMLRHGPTPDELTFSVLTSTFCSSDHSVLIPQLHGLVIHLGHGLNIYLGSALMRAYVSLRDCGSFLRVFDEISVKDVAPCNVLILGYMEFGLMNDAKRAFDMMPVRSAYSWSIMINGYIKNRMVNEAKIVFDCQKDKDVVSWSAMIRGLVQYDKFLEAIYMFHSMMNTGTRPNHYTLSSVLDACAGGSFLAIGHQVQACIFKFGIPLDVILATSLVDMYGKCGDIDSAFRVFESMSAKNLVTWNSIIGGYGRHGLASRALEEFERMVNSGMTPDEISFISVLSACVHGGMVEEGEELFNSIHAKYGMRAVMEHYSCMVDLYGRAGQLEKAEELIKCMPFEPDVVVWGALLGACGLYSCIDLGQTAANGISKLEQDHPAIYSILPKIYGGNGVRSGGIQLEEMGRKWQTRKQKAGSWIESSP